MPAPVVYVLAIVGTVGAVLAFKEFVYEPHIAPAFDRWKDEFLAAREARRRERAVEAYQDQSDADVQMSEARRKSKGRSSDKYSDDDSSDDEDDDDHGKRAATTSHSFMKDGLLLRRPNLATKNNDVELDNLLAREVHEWRNESNGQVLRHRKNVSEHAMDESILAVPYTPLSPSRTHVIFDSSAPSPSTPSTQRELPSLPSSPAIYKAEVLPTETISSESPLPQERQTTPPPAIVLQETFNFTERSVSNIESASQASSLAPLEPNLMDTNDHISSSPPEMTPFQHMVTQSTLLGRTPSLPPTFNVPPSSIPVYTPTHPLQHSYHQVVPSLSQSYPQELDYEHDLELLSPPSSRSESPFSLAALSPDSNARALSPLNNMGSHPGSGLSYGVSSPSPLRMSLGNQSYDAISPIQQFQSMSPFLDPPSDNASATHSSRSTTYLSFEEDGSDDEHAQPYANLGASIGVEGTFGPTSSQIAQPQQQPQQRTGLHQPTVLHPSLVHGPYSNTPYPRDTSRIAHITPTIGRMGSESTLTTGRADEGLGLGLFPVPSRDARTPSVPSSPLFYAASRTANAAVAIGRGSGNPAYFRPSSAAGAGAKEGALSPVAPSFSTSASYQTSTAATSTTIHGQVPHTPAQSDSELSDLDFMSDFTQSESDLGNESDSAWSLASEPVEQGQGRQFGSPRAGPGPSARGGDRFEARGPQGEGEARTVREAQGGRLWRA